MLTSVYVYVIQRDVRSVETEPRCITDLYHGAVDHRYALLS